MKSSKTSFLRNCISGWNVRLRKKLRNFGRFLFLCYICLCIRNASQYEQSLSIRTLAPIRWSRSPTWLARLLWLLGNS